MKTITYYYMRISTYGKSKTYCKAFPWDGAYVHALQMMLVGEVVQTLVSNLIDKGLLNEKDESAAYQYHRERAMREMTSRFWEVEKERA